MSPFSCATQLLQSTFYFYDSAADSPGLKLLHMWLCLNFPVKYAPNKSKSYFMTI